MSTLIGANAGIIQSPMGFLAIALKITDDSGYNKLIYLPPDQLQSLFFAIINCYRKLTMLNIQSPELIKPQVIQATRELNNNIPTVTADELNNPVASLRVIDFILHQRKDSASLLFFLEGGETVLVVSKYTQFEYLLSLLLNTIHSTGDETLERICLNSSDFILCYTVDFGSLGNKGISYNQFSVPDWKSDMFDTFHSIIYIQDDGSIPCGVIIKSEANFASGRIDNIGQLLLDSQTLLAPYRHLDMHVDHLPLAISADERNMDTMFRAHLAHRQAKLI